MKKERNNDGHDCKICMDGYVSVHDSYFWFCEIPSDLVIYVCALGGVQFEYGCVAGMVAAGCLL